MFIPGGRGGKGKGGDEKKKRFRHTLALKRIGRNIILADVDNSVDVEGNLLGVGAPALVSKAICVLSVALGGERVVAIGNCLFVGLVLALGIADLFTFIKCWLAKLCLCLSA